MYVTKKKATKQSRARARAENKILKERVQSEYGIDGIEIKNPKLSNRGYSKLVETGIVYGRLKYVKLHNRNGLQFSIWLNQSNNTPTLQVEKWLIFGTENIEKAVQMLRIGYTLAICGERRTIIYKEPNGNTIYNQVNVAKNIVILSSQVSKTAKKIDEVKIYDRTLY